MDDTLLTCAIAFGVVLLVGAALFVVPALVQRVIARRLDRPS